MSRPLFAIALALLASAASAQQISGGGGAPSAANSLSGNPTASAATRQDVAVPGCNAIGKALGWITSSGFTCNAAIEANQLAASSTINAPFSTSGGGSTVSACGTSPTSTGNSSDGRVVVGSGAPTSCTITFHGSDYGTSVRCRVSAETGQTFSYSVTTTAITLTSSGLSGAFDYACDGS